MIDGGDIARGIGLFTLYAPLAALQSPGSNFTTSTFSGNLALRQDSTFTISNALVVSASVSSPTTYTLTKTGTGPMYLTSSNSYTVLTVAQQRRLHPQNAFA